MIDKSVCIHPNKHVHPAVFILHDPVQWAEEIQVLCDLIEGGVLATHPQHAHRKQVGADTPLWWLNRDQTMLINRHRTKQTNNNKQTTNKQTNKQTNAHTPQHIPVYASNADRVFSSTYSVPRLAQGSFVEAWQHVYKTCYPGGPDIEVTRFGKPFEVAYRYAERLLVHEARAIGALPPDPAPHEDHAHRPFPLRRVYMIGDNPASDIEGAASRGDPWTSILVRSGVFEDDQEHPADHVVDDVAAALRLILELEGRPLL